MWVLISALGEEMPHLCLCHQLLRSYRCKQAKQEVGNWPWVVARLKKKSIMLQKNPVFCNSLFGEVLETMPWFRESLSMAAWETPYVFVMGVTPHPSSPLAPTSGLNQSCSLSPASPCHIAPCIVDARANSAQTLGFEGGCVACPRS